MDRNKKNKEVVILEVGKDGKTHYHPLFFVYTFLAILMFVWMIYHATHNRILNGMGYEQIENNNYVITLYDEQHKDTLKVYTSDEIMASFLSNAKKIYCQTDSDGISFDGFKLDKKYFKYSIVDD